MRTRSDTLRLAVNGLAHHRPGRRSVPTYWPKSVTTMPRLGSTTKNPANRIMSTMSASMNAIASGGESMRAAQTMPPAQPMSTSGRNTSIAIPELNCVSFSRIMVGLLLGGQLAG